MRLIMDSPKEDFFWRWSVTVCRYPRPVIITCAVFTAICSLGLLQVKVITNPDQIWVPPDSLASRQKEFFDSSFSPFFRVNQVFFVAENPGRETANQEGRADMINEHHLQRVMSVQRAIESANITSDVDGESLSLESLCFRPIDGEGCLVESPSQFWLNDPVLLAGDWSPSLTAACHTTDAFLEGRSPCMDQIGTPVMRNVVFGGLRPNPDIPSPDPCGGSVPSAGALVLTVLLNNYQDQAFQARAQQWEKEVFLRVAEEAKELLQNDVQAPMKVSYMAQRSVADSLSVEAGENAWILGVSYMCMFVYVSVALGSWRDSVRSRYLLGLTGITIVVASLAVSLGILSTLGVGTTLIVWEVVPFLTLAIGVDNMFLITREFDRLEAVPEFESTSSSSPDRDNIEKRRMFPPGNGMDGSSVFGRTPTRLHQRMGSAVSKVAPSILGAAVCEALAFAVGSLTDIPALRQFCLVATAAVVSGFFFQVTWFVAALSLDTRRVSQGRFDLMPWKTKGARASSSLRGSTSQPSSSLSDEPLTRPLLSPTPGNNLATTEGINPNIGGDLGARGVIGAGWGGVGHLGSISGDISDGTAGNPYPGPEGPFQSPLLLGAGGVFSSRRGLAGETDESRRSVADGAAREPMGSLHSTSSLTSIGVKQGPGSGKGQGKSQGQGQGQGQGQVCELGRDGFPEVVGAPSSQGAWRTGEGLGSGEGAGLGGMGVPQRILPYQDGFIERYYLPVLFSRVGKIVTSLASVGLLLLGVLGMINLQMGLEPQLAAPTNFYLQDYYDAQFSLGEAGPPAYLVLTDIDYYKAFRDPQAAQELRGISTGLAQLQRYVQAPIYSWFDTMTSWVNQGDTLSSDCPAQIEIRSEADYYAMVETFLSIPIESQCCQSYGMCGAQFRTDVAFDGEDELGLRRIQASRLRFNMQPLASQRDYVNSFFYIKTITNRLADKVSERYEGQRNAWGVGNLAFPYSLYFVFYEQYTYIQGVALQNIALAVGVVLLSVGVLTGFQIASIVTALVLSTALGTVGLVWAWGELSPAPYKVSVNAVSVCNLVMALGLSVEFCLHISAAFKRMSGSRQERAAAAMKDTGSSVLTGITLTKLVGVSVLAVAPSRLFRLYYFRMYICLILSGGFQGLAALPVLLSWCGPHPASSCSRLYPSSFSAASTRRRRSQSGGRWGGNWGRSAPNSNMDLHPHEFHQGAESSSDDEIFFRSAEREAGGSRKGGALGRFFGSLNDGEGSEKYCAPPGGARIS